MYVNLKVNNTNSNNVLQMANLTDTERTRENPNRRRVYYINGISPCVVDYSGG